MDWIRSPSQLTSAASYQSEMNLKAIWSQSEIWKINLKLNSREKSILYNLKLNSRDELIGHNLKLNSRGSFIVAAHLYSSIRANSSLAPHRSALTWPSLSTLIASALDFCSELTLTASSKTRISSSIMSLSTPACHPPPLPTVLILSALVVHGLYWVFKHSKI